MKCLALTLSCTSEANGLLHLSASFKFLFGTWYESFTSPDPQDTS